MALTADVVDSHQHFWDLSVRDQPWLRRPGNEPLLKDFTEADLRPLAAAAGVTATILVQTVIEPGETPDLLTLAAASDLVAGVVGWVDLQTDDVADALAALQARPDGGHLRGIRHPVVVEPDPDWLRRPAVHRGLSAVGRAGLCYDVVVPPEVLPATADAVAACPDVTFVLDHLGNPDIDERPDPAWSLAIRRLGEFPNVFCKLSGILGEPDAHRLRLYYETVLAAFGPDRLMFGSDWPPCTLEAPYEAVVAAARELVADLSAAEQAAILSGTAIRAYRLRTAGELARRGLFPCDNARPLKLIMKISNVVPMLLLSPVFSSDVVPALLPWRQQGVDVVAEIGGSAAAPGHCCC